MMDIQISQGFDARRVVAPWRAAVRTQSFNG